MWDFFTAYLHHLIKSVGQIDPNPSCYRGNSAPNIWQASVCSKGIFKIFLRHFENVLKIIWGFLKHVFRVFQGSFKFNWRLKSVLQMLEGSFKMVSRGFKIVTSKWQGYFMEDSKGISKVFQRFSKDLFWRSSQWFEVSTLWKDFLIPLNIWQFVSKEFKEVHWCFGSADF